MTAAFLQFSRSKELTDHLYWMALLGFLVIRGPGPLSLDYFIASHLRSSAMPGGELFGRVAGTLKRFVLPAYQAVARWLSPGCCGTRASVPRHRCCTA